MQLIIAPDGTGRCLYGELIDLNSLGTLEIHRASHLEADEQGRWWADLAPSGGPKLGPYRRRSEALGAEEAWLIQYGLGRGPGPDLSSSKGIFLWNVCS
jgi:hypothetical protein